MCSSLGYGTTHASYRPVDKWPGAVRRSLPPALPASALRADRDGGETAERDATLANPATGSSLSVNGWRQEEPRTSRRTDHSANGTRSSAQRSPHPRSVHIRYQLSNRSGRASPSNAGHVTAPAVLALDAWPVGARFGIATSCSTVWQSVSLLNRTNRVGKSADATQEPRLLLSPSPSP